ncbi:aldo/keto reductase [Novosphingobium sp. TH158]|uniref:aldo/keto reductase n=1 Tax=Novosphingobium sp. TH158 TaxID=2067455 RepID=UPI000C7A8DAF|nr:aldo/keto reductase [Novosphingobium sp. TH158]PLK25964.1 alcohol dehydrogenase [Novosphingobium sp. TH158]
MPEAHPGLGGLPLVLGGNAFGWTIDRDASFAVLDAFYEAGGRSIDTAEGYSNWVPGNKGGESEAIIGEWMESRGVRPAMKIATKTGQAGPAGAYAPEKVIAACNGSLERLRTDWIDLYYVHRDDLVTPPSDVADGFGSLAAAGKVRELATSNTTAERLCAFNEAARAKGYTPFTVIQPGYNLVWRSDYEPELEALALREGMAVLPYYGLAAGFLTGKYTSEADFGPGWRPQNASQFASDAAWAALPVLNAVAEEAGATMGQVALAWLASRPGVWAPIASATSAAQVRDLCAYASVQLSDRQLARLNAVSVDA